MKDLAAVTLTLLGLGVGLIAIAGSIANDHEPPKQRPSELDRFAMVLLLCYAVASACLCVLVLIQ